MAGLSLAALKLLVAADPIQASQPLATVLCEVRQERGEFAEQEVFEAVLEGLGPESKFVLREMFPGRSRWKRGTELREIAFRLWDVYRRADREILLGDDLRKALQSLGHPSQVQGFLERCLQEGLLYNHSASYRINSSLMGRGLATSPLLLP